MRFLRFVGRVLGKGILNLLGVLLVVGLWYVSPQSILWLLDSNLAALKWICGSLPAPYGAMCEVVLQPGLGLEKFLLFSEAILVVKCIWGMFMFRPNEQSVLEPIVQEYPDETPEEKLIRFRRSQ